MTILLADRRVAHRSTQLEAIAAAANLHGATALHLKGSLGRQSGDALSDIDVWLTFPDAATEQTVRDRDHLYREVGEMLLKHEAVGNSPVGGAFSLVLYQTPNGPMEVDWSIAPQQTSRRSLDSTAIFEHVRLPVGDPPIDTEALQEETLSERLTWLTCMLFVSIKMVVRHNRNAFLPFLREAYRDISVRYRLEGLTVTEPISLTQISAMLEQLLPYADSGQRLAVDAIAKFCRELDQLPSL